MIDRAAVPSGDHTFQGERYGLCQAHLTDGTYCWMPREVHAPSCGRCGHDFDNHDLTHGRCIDGYCPCPAYRIRAVAQ